MTGTYLLEFLLIFGCVNSANPSLNFVSNTNVSQGDNLTELHIIKGEGTTERFGNIVKGEKTTEQFGNIIKDEVTTERFVNTIKTELTTENFDDVANKRTDDGIIPDDPDICMVNGSGLNMESIFGGQCKHWLCSEDTCYCDDNCLLLKDCCADVFELNYKVGNESEIYTILEEPLDFLNARNTSISEDILKLQKYSSCLQIFLVSHPVIVSYLVIDKCPENYIGARIIVEKCEGLNIRDIENVYVYKTKGDDLIFRNIFCAICHGIDIIDITVWNNSLYCIKESDASFSQIPDSCLIKYSVLNREHRFRRCVHDIVGQPNCSMNSDIESLKCSGYYNPVVMKKVYYKNEFCLPCDKSENVSLQNCASREVFHEDMSHHMGPSFNHLFRIKNDIFKIDENEIACGDGMIYDLYTFKCKQVQCLNGQVFVNRKCETMDMPVLYNSSLNRPFDQANTSTNLFHLKIHFINIENEGINKDIPSYSIILDWLENNVDCYYINHQFLSLDSSFVISGVTKIHLPDVLSRTIACIQGLTANINFVSSATLSNINEQFELSCPENFNLATSTNITIQLLSDGAVASSGADQLSDLLFAKFKITLMQGHRFGDIVHVCHPESLDCPSFITFKTDQFELVDGILRINGAIVDNKKFTIQNETLFLCPKENSKKDTSIGVILYICAPLSVIALLLVIILHLCIPKLLNMYGKNLVCFSTVLMISQLMNLTCEFLPSIMKPGLSVVLHYVWTSTFAFMSVIAFDICRTFFSKTMMTNNGDEKSRFVCYCLFGFGVPGILVLVCALLDFAVDNSLFGYGTYLCWMANKNAVMYSFYIPVLVLYTATVAFFCATLISIETSTRQTKNIAKRSVSRNMCVIYSKLSVVTGLAWLLVFISSNVNVPVLSYASAILNGLQGFFVCIFTMFNQRTIKQIKERKNSKHSTTFSNI